MNFSQIRRLNELWRSKDETNERIDRLEKALMLLAETIDERLTELELRNGKTNRR